MIDFRCELFKLSSDKYRDFQKKIVPNIPNIIGVQIPKIRKFSKKLSYEEKMYFLDISKKEYLEEKILMGFIICDLKLDINDILKYTKEYVDLIDNWCVCDIFCSSFHITNKYLDAIFNFIQDYLYSDKEYYIRFGLVMLLYYFINDNYVDDVFNIISSVNCKNYYDKMALAWLISTLYTKYSDRTINFLKSCNLDKFTHNKSIQKIIESNKVSDKEKNYIRNLKK